jgi:hypothetical protein
MTSTKNVGRIVGLLFLVQAALAPLVYFRWITPMRGASFLETAARSALQIRVAVLLMFVLGALTLAIAIAATPVFRRYSERMALSFLALSIVGLSTLAIESIALRTMLALSQEYAKATDTKELLQTLGGMARSTSYWAHYTNLMFSHAAAVVFNIILFRFALVPRAIPAFGMAATLLSTAAVTMPLLGYRFVFLMLMPVSLSQLALMLWLIVRGFEERQPLVRSDGERIELAHA